MKVRPEYDFKVIGNNLRKLRIKNGLTVEEVRQYMQLGTVQSIYKWERGEGLPQADSLIALLELYGENRIDTITEERGNLSSQTVDKGPISILRLDFFFCIKHI